MVVVLSVVVGAVVASLLVTIVVSLLLTTVVLSLTAMVVDVSLMDALMVVPSSVNVVVVSDSVAVSVSLIAVLVSMVVERAVVVSDTILVEPISVAEVAMLWGLHGPALTEANKARFANAAAISLLKTILAGFQNRKQKQGKRRWRLCKTE
jgi:hypothetical protein